MGFKPSRDPDWSLRKRRKKVEKKWKVLLGLQRISFSVAIKRNEWAKIYPSLKHDKDRSTYRLNGPWTRIMNEKIYSVMKLPCAFSFTRDKFYKEPGRPYFKIFDYCSKCRQELIGECIKEEENGVNIEFKCFNTCGSRHRRCAIQFKGETRVNAYPTLLKNQPK